MQLLPFLDYDENASKLKLLQQVYLLDTAMALILVDHNLN